MAKKFKNNKEDQKKFSSFGIEKERDYFIENTSMLIMGGVPIIQAIDSVKEGVKSKRMKDVIDSIKEDIGAGLPIWKSFSRARIFPHHVISLIKLGEESGKLDDSLRAAVNEQEKSRVFRSKIYSAMMYPVFVLTLSSFIGIGISWFVLPRLAETFSQLRIELPIMTKVLIEIGAFLGNYGQYVIPLFILLVILKVFFLFFYSKTRFIGQAILFRVPGVGKLIKEVEVARFGYLLGTLLESGIPIKQALFSLREATESTPYKKLYRHLEKGIEEGDSFQKSFKSFKRVDEIIPLPVQQLVFAGEKSGALSEVLLKIGKKFEEKTDGTTKNLTVILEPVMLVLVGASVAFIAIGVILPIYSLVGGVNDGGQEESTRERTPREESITSSDINIIEERSERIRALSVNGGHLPVFREPSLESEVVAEIMPGEEMYYIKKEDLWYKIFLVENEEGWVFEEHVEVIKEDEE